MGGTYRDERTPLLSDEIAKNTVINDGGVQWEEQIKGRKNCI